MGWSDQKLKLEKISWPEPSIKMGFSKNKTKDKRFWYNRPFDMKMKKLRCLLIKWKLPLFIV